VIPPGPRRDLAESVGAAVGGLIDVTTRQVDQVSAWTRRDH